MFHSKPHYGAWMDNWGDDRIQVYRWSCLEERR